MNLSLIDFIKDTSKDLGFSQKEEALIVGFVLISYYRNLFEAILGANISDKSFFEDLDKILTQWQDKLSDDKRGVVISVTTEATAKGLGEFLACTIKDLDESKYNILMAKVKQLGQGINESR
jgi:hypothetical protein